MSSEPYRILVVGVGSIGERHLRCFQSTSRATLSLCEVNDALRSEIQQRYAVAQVYTDLATALGDPHDAVVVATPAPLHVAMTTQALQAGCHVLVEKPLSTSLDGVSELVRLAASAGKIVAVGYNWRNHPSLIAMRDAVRSGRFGDPVQMTIVTGQHFPTFRPAYREIYYAQHETGGGAIQDGLTHMIDAGQWLVGPIDRLVADAAHQVLPDVEVEDTVNVIARHGDVLATYVLNQHQAPNETTITVVCQRGTVRLESHRHRWRWIDTPQPTGEWHEETVPPLQRDDLYIAQASAFLDAVAGRRPPLCTLEEGVQALKANLAMLASVKSQAWETL